MNRLVKVERMRAVTERLRKLTRFRHDGALNAIAQPRDVQEVEGEQAEEDQELRPLRRVAAEGAQVFEDQQSDRPGQEEEEPMEETRRARRARTRRRLPSAPLNPAVAAEVEVARHGGRGQVAECRVRREDHQVIARLRPVAPGRRQQAGRHPAAGPQRMLAKRQPVLHVAEPVARVRVSPGRPPEPHRQDR